MLFWATTSFTTGPRAAPWVPASAGPASVAAAIAEAKPAAAVVRSPRPGLFMTSPPGPAAGGRRSRRGAGPQSVDVSPAAAVTRDINHSRTKKDTARVQEFTSAAARTVRRHRRGAGHLRARRRKARREHLQQARPGPVGHRPPPGAGRPALPGAVTGDTARRGAIPGCPGSAGPRPVLGGPGSSIGPMTTP